MLTKMTWPGSPTFFQRPFCCSAVTMPREGVSLGAWTASRFGYSLSVSTVTLSMFLSSPSVGRSSSLMSGYCLNAASMPSLRSRQATLCNAP